MSKPWGGKTWLWGDSCPPCLPIARWLYATLKNSSLDIWVSFQDIGPVNLGQDSDAFETRDLSLTTGSSVTEPSVSDTDVVDVVTKSLWAVLMFVFQQQLKFKFTNKCSTTREQNPVTTSACELGQLSIICKPRPHDTPTYRNKDVIVTPVQHGVKNILSQSNCSSTRTVTNYGDCGGLWRVTN